MIWAASRAAAQPVGLKIGLFDIDATPPVGSWMAYDPVTNKWDLGLRGRGVVLLGAGDPIVLCALDWIGIANGGQDVFRESLAKAAGTKPDRVAVHCIHQHDAPDCDFSAESILKEAGLELRQFEGGFQRQVLADLSNAVRHAISNPIPVTHVGTGQAEVKEVASNRRLLGPDGKVKTVRWSANKDAAVRAEPEGLIDPMVSLVSFWNGENPVAVLSYYATHPQSYYRTGIPNPDFPGLARFQRQIALPSVLHVHFNGAGGNVTAGKYNDGSMENRAVLAGRLADGMRRAWDGTKKSAIQANEVGWTVAPVALPVSPHMNAEKLEAQMRGRDAAFYLQGGPSRLAWMRRCQAGYQIPISCLKLGGVRILNMPGELFVEYQLAAKAERPDLFVAMAAYGEYGPWYIGTAVSYEQGGYETGPTASNVAPEVEAILTKAMKTLLRSK